MTELSNKLNETKKDCLKELLSSYKKANAGHIGSALSCLDLLVYLYFSKMENCDKFILSKGHAAAALYTVLYKRGVINKEVYDTYYKDGTNLPAHPPCTNKLKGVTFGTGSLGHGLSLALGIALANKFKKNNSKSYCIVSDGDCNEGSTWEAALFAGHHKLSNLITIVDHNKLQGFGLSSDVMNLEPLRDKWSSFGWDVYEILDPHNFNEIESCFEDIKLAKNNKPKCVIAHTIKGKGISFMENRLEWHYLSMTDEQYLKALAEIEGIDA